jgi:hypothetical protein
MSFIIIIEWPDGHSTGFISEQKAAESVRRFWRMQSGSLGIRCRNAASSKAFADAFCQIAF